MERWSDGARERQGDKKREKSIFLLNNLFEMTFRINRMKFLFTYIIALFLLTSLYAQQDSQAGAILDKVAEKNKSFQTIKASFQLTVIDLQQDSKDVFDGNIALKEGMFKLELMDNITFYDTTTVWNYMPDVQEVNINAAEDVDIGNSFLTNPASLFTMYKEDYKYRLIGEKKIEKEIQYFIDLVPKEMNSEYSSIKLLISKKDLSLQSATLMRKDGIHYIIKITLFEHDIKLEDSYFRFNPAKHPDVEVIDMR